MPDQELAIWKQHALMTMPAFTCKRLESGNPRANWILQALIVAAIDRTTADAMVTG